MKTLISLSILLFSIQSLAGGFKFPNVNYDHAKLYLMNIDLKEGPRFADFDIYKDGVYANSKMGDGELLTEDCLKSLHGVLKSGVDEIVYGLGKCYLPRHGIIYFDKLGAPVASLTICLECHRISIWSLHTLAPFKDVEELNNWEKGEKQMLKIEKILKDNDFPVFDDNLNYVSYMNSNENYKQVGEVFITDNNLDSLYFKKYSMKQVKMWVNKGAKHFHLNESLEVKISAGGEKWEYKQLEDKRGTRFIFSFDKDNPFLVEAYINNSAVILPNGNSVGMSQGEIITSLGVYNGLSNPEKITVSDKMLQIEYIFKRRTLSEIKLSFSIL